MYFKPPRQDSLTQYSSERDKAWFGTQENVMWGQHRLMDPKRTSRDHLPICIPLGNRSRNFVKTTQ